MIELVALDIAGTTVDEGNLVYRALENSVVAAGGSPTADDIQRWMGASKQEAIAALTGLAFDSAEVVDAFADFRDRLATFYREHPPRPFDGVAELFADLRAAGVCVALTTGFDREVTKSLLDSIGWDDSMLDTVQCIDDVRQGRPAPYLIFRAMEATGVLDVGNVLVAGDTPRDIEGGRNAGAGIVAGVLTGGVSREDLEAAKPTFVLDDVTQIREYVLR